MTFIELVKTNNGLLITITLILGLIIGSFLNVVIYRIPIMLRRAWKQQYLELADIVEPNNEITSSSSQYRIFSLYSPPSHCSACAYKIRPWENIPVVSYFLLGGKCSHCEAKISIRYPSVEVASSILSALVAFTFGVTWLTLSLLIFTWSLIVLTLIDLDHQLLPDNLTIPLLWLGLFVNTVDFGLGVSINDAVIGAITGYLILWAFYWIFKLITGREGMGYGDFKLLAALGAWLGWQSLLPILILSSLIGALIGTLMILFLGKDKSMPMPFGPYLSGAGFIMLIWGPQISSFYIGNFIS